jgi:hypothetical protein
MTPDQFCKKVQRQVRKIERNVEDLHKLLSEGVDTFTPELTAMGVDVVPLSGGGPKPPREDED